VTGRVDAQAEWRGPEVPVNFEQTAQFIDALVDRRSTWCLMQGCSASSIDDIGWGGRGGGWLINSGWDTFLPCF
jgi:hypothetical protein